jgi:hypothetical protein
MYVAGWIKRRPSGVIGINGTANETVAALVDEFVGGLLPARWPAAPA